MQRQGVLGTGSSPSVWYSSVIFGWSQHVVCAWWLEAQKEAKVSGWESSTQRQGSDHGMMSPVLVPQAAPPGHSRIGDAQGVVPITGARLCWSQLELSASPSPPPAPVAATEHNSLDVVWHFVGGNGSLPGNLNRGCKERGAEVRPELGAPWGQCC